MITSILRDGFMILARARTLLGIPPADDGFGAESDNKFVPLIGVFHPSDGSRRFVKGFRFGCLELGSNTDGAEFLGTFQGGDGEGVALVKLVILQDFPGRFGVLWWWKNGGGGVCQICVCVCVMMDDNQQQHHACIKSTTCIHRNANLPRQSRTRPGRHQWCCRFACRRACRPR